MEHNDNISFVARFYRAGAFSARKAWKAMEIEPAHRWTFWRVAAASLIAVALTGSAFLVFRNLEVDRVEETTLEVAPDMVVKTIDFDNASLPTVVQEIKATYGVEIEGLPENAAQYRLTLHYEGNVNDLVESINDILGLELKVKK